MSSHPPVRRFGINPVEVVIFSVVGLVFANSVYSLFKEREQIHGAGLALLNQTPGTMGMQASLGGRMPASMNSIEKVDSEELDITCSLAPLEHQTSAQGLKVKGKLCTSASSKVELKDRSSKAKYFGQLSEDRATFVFDKSVPLQLGKNELSLVFTLASGKTVVREITIVRH